MSRAQAQKKIAEILGSKLPGLTNAEAPRAHKEHELITDGGNQFQPSGLLQQR